MSAPREPVAGAPTTMVCWQLRPFRRPEPPGPDSPAPGLVPAKGDPRAGPPRSSGSPTSRLAAMTSRPSSSGVETCCARLWRPPRCRRASCARSGASSTPFGDGGPSGWRSRSPTAFVPWPSGAAPARRVADEGPGRPPDRARNGGSGGAGASLPPHRWRLGPRFAPRRGPDRRPPGPSSPSSSSIGTAGACSTLPRRPRADGVPRHRAHRRRQRLDRRLARTVPRGASCRFPSGSSGTTKTGRSPRRTAGRRGRDRRARPVPRTTTSSRSSTTGSGSWSRR